MMVRFEDYTANITIGLEDYKMAEVLGIENGDREMEVAYEVIDWVEMENILTEIAIALVAKNGIRVRDTLRLTEASEHMHGDADDDTDSDIKTTERPDDSVPFDGIWCRFGNDDQRSSPEHFDVDITPVLDGMPLANLPAYAEDFHMKAYAHGQGLWAAALILGILDDRRHYYFDAIDEVAYEHYYDERCQREGRPSVER